MTAPSGSAGNRAADDARGYVFISYARKDGAYVAKLAAYLEANGVPAWYDREIPNGQRWRQTLRSRVEQAAAVLLVESPHAQESEWVEHEIIHGERHRRAMLVLLLEGKLRYGTAELQAETVAGGMPSERFLARARELVAQATEYVAPAPAFKGGAVIPPEAWQYRRPEGMVDRPAQVEQTARALRSGMGAVAVTGIYGGGGLGKTVVARMVVARKDVQAAFSGGLLWVDLGQERRDATLADLIGDLCIRVGGKHPQLFDPVEAGKHLTALLAARPATLVVLDDAWLPEQLEPFLDVNAGPARFLVTTRVTSLLPSTATAISVEQLDGAQSRAVLLAGLPTMPDAAVERLLEATGGWALVVNSANAILRRAIRDGNDPATYAARLVQLLTADGVGGLDLGNRHAREATFAATMRPSLALLSADERRRAYELSIFAEDTDIDLGLLGLLWGATGGLIPSQTRALAAELRDLNLLTDFRPGVGLLRVHDLVRAHLAGELGADGIRTANATLLDAAASHFKIGTDHGGRAWWELPASADYMWSHLAAHMAAVGPSSELDGLLSDLRWTQAKLLGAGAGSLDADLARSAIPAVAGLRQALHREAHLLGPVAPAHSHADTLAARLGTSPALTEAVGRFRQTMPDGLARTQPGWPLPDAPVSAIRRVLTGHADRVTAVAIAPDGTWLATASEDKTVRLWDAATGRERATLAGHTHWVTDVAIAPDGTWVVSVSYDRTARLWDSATGHERAVLEDMPMDMTGVAIAPNGTWIATSYRWGTVLVDATTGDDLAVLGGHGQQVTGVAIAPDGTWLATTGWDDNVRLWETPPAPRSQRRWPFGRRPPVTRHPERAILTGHTGFVSGVAISPDGTWLATTGEEFDKTVRLWDAATGEERAVLAGHDLRVTGVAIAPDGNWLATTGYDNAVRIWDSATGAARATLTGHTAWTSAVAIAPDGRWLATASYDGTVRLWDTPTEPERAAPTGHTRNITAIAVAPDGTWLATASRDKTICLWDAATGNLSATLARHTTEVKGVAIATDGAWLATIAEDDPIFLWNRAPRYSEHRRGFIDGRTRYLTAVALAPDGTWLATRNQAGTIRLWDIRTRLELAALEPPGEFLPSPDPTRIGSLAIAPDGTWLATCGNEPVVRVWDTSTGTERAMLNGHDDLVNAVCIAPDGTWLATVSADHTVRLWDASTAIELAAFPGVTGGAGGIAISPSGGQLATASSDGTMRVWDTATGANLATMRVAGSLGCVCWAPDGRAIFAAGQYGPYRFDINVH